MSRYVKISEKKKIALVFEINLEEMWPKNKRNNAKKPKKKPKKIRTAKL